MTRLAMRTTVTGLAAMSLLSAATTHAQTPVFPVGTDRVIVDVMVTDGDGRPVPGLTRADFVVEDEGAPQDIVEFEAVDVAEPPAEATEAILSSRVAANDPSPASSRAFLIVFDDLNLSPASGERVAAALRRFLELQLRDTDCVTVAPTAGGAWWSGCLGSDRADLDAFLGRMSGRRRPDMGPERMSDYEAMRIHADRDREATTHVSLRLAAHGVAQASADLTSRDTSQNQMAAAEAAAPLVRTMAAEVYGRVEERNTLLLRNVERGVRALGSGRGRRVVILASDGFIQDQRLPGFQRVREAARRANAALYFVDARTNEEPISLTAMAGLPDPENRFSYLSNAHEYAAVESAGAESLAADTGGFTVRGADLHQGLARISAESRVFYLIAFEPSTQGREGRFRKLKVTVRRPGVKVRARAGYYPGPAAPEDKATGEPPPPVRRALESIDEARDLPLRMTSYVLGNAGGGRIKVLLAAEVDPAGVTLTPRDSLLLGGMDSFSTLAGRDSGELGRKELGHDLALQAQALPGLGSTWLPVTHLYELAPGRYQARMAVIDRSSGRAGSVRHTFDVPSPIGLRMATPVLTDVLAPGDSPDAPARPLPVARRSFAVGSRLVCGVEVWGGRTADEKSSLEIVYEVRRADGSVVARTDPRPLAPVAGGAHADTFKLTLNRAGEYELRLRARDKASAEEVLTVERFWVIAPPGGAP